MSYILNLFICIGMILVENLPQCLLFIAMIDLSSTCDCIRMSAMVSPANHYGRQNRVSFKIINGERQFLSQLVEDQKRARGPV
jgi:hypothetical protein